MVSTWTWDRQIHPGWLSSELQGPLFLCLLSTEAACVPTTGFFTGVLEDWIQALIMINKCLTNCSISQILHKTILVYPSKWHSDYIGHSVKAILVVGNLSSLNFLFLQYWGQTQGFEWAWQCFYQRTTPPTLIWEHFSKQVFWDQVLLSSNPGNTFFSVNACSLSLPLAQVRIHPCYACLTTS